MKKTQKFSMNKRQELICTSKEEDLEIFHKEDEALSYLEELDNIRFDKVIVTECSIRLINSNTRVVIQNLDAFYEQGLTDLFPKTYNTMKKAIVKYTKSQAEGKNKQNIKRGTKVVQITSLVFMLLAGGATAKKVVQSEEENRSYIVSVEELPSVDDFKVDEEIENALLESDPIFSNEMIEELENELESEILDTEFLTEDPIEMTDEVNNQAKIDETIGNPVYLDFELTNDRVKKEYAASQFYDICAEGAQDYGWSTNIPMSMLTQESAGKEKNLMQIQFNEWNDEPQRVFNFTKNQYETFMLTNTPEKYADKEYIIVTEKDLDDPRTNIRVGCALLRKSAEAMHYHLLAAIQCYNLGIGNMEDVLGYTAEVTGQEVDDILSDQTNASFAEYTYLPGVGDPKYLSNVFAFLDGYGEEITYKHFNKNDEIIEERINIFSHQQKL